MKMLQTSLILLVSLLLSSSTIAHRHTNFTQCEVIEGFDCQCSNFRLKCETSRHFPSTLITFENVTTKYKSVELTISTAENIEVNNQTFESINKLFENNVDVLQFRIVFQNYIALDLSSPGLFNNIFPNNLTSYSRKTIALHIFNPEVSQKGDQNLFENLNVDMLEIYSVHSFHGTFQQLFNGSNIKYLRFAWSDILSSNTQLFTGNIQRFELAKRASSLSIESFPLYPVHEFIINAYDVTEFNSENPPNYSNLVALRIYSWTSIPAKAFQEYANIHTLSITTNSSIDENALDGLNNLEKLSIQEKNPSLIILNKIKTVKYYETNIKKLDEDSQCELINRFAKGEMFVRALGNDDECNCMIVYLSIPMGRAPCDIDACENSTCPAIRDNYKSWLRAFKVPPNVLRADGTSVLDPNRLNVSKIPYQIRETDINKFSKTESSTLKQTLSTDNGTLAELETQTESSKKKDELASLLSIALSVIIIIIVLVLIIAFICKKSTSQGYRSTSTTDQAT